VRGKCVAAVAGNYIDHDNVTGWQCKAAFIRFTAAGGAEQRKHHQGRGGRAAGLTYIGVCNITGGAGFHAVILITSAIIIITSFVCCFSRGLAGRMAYVNMAQAKYEAKQGRQY